MDIQESPQIIIIDDDASFAKQCAVSLQNKYGMRVVASSTAEDALQHVKQFPIKVAVIDQVMPTKGTELLPKLKLLNPRLKSILLTADATKSDLVRGSRLFDVVLLKDAEDMVRLPVEILLLLMNYNHCEQERNAEPFYVERFNKGLKGIFKKRFAVEYYIIDQILLEKEHVCEDRWTTRNLIERGETLTFEQEIDIDREFQFANDFSIENSSEFECSIEHFANFKLALATRMQEDLKISYTESLKQKMTRKLERNLPSDASDIVSRAYEYAKVVQVYRIFVKIVCSCCKGERVEAINVSVPIPIIKYRIREYHHDGNTTELDSGEIRA